LRIAQWLNGEVALPPPIFASIDPTSHCPYDCVWCNSYSARKTPAEIPTELLLEMPKFLKSWGVKAACVGGGGESLAHPDWAKFILTLRQEGLGISCVTNGFYLDRKDDDENIFYEVAIDCMRWIGISVDAGTKATYEYVHGTKDSWKKILENIRAMVEYKRKTCANTQITFKFLMSRENYREIFEASQLAKDLGCDVFHLRPVGTENLEIFAGREPRPFAQGEVELASTLMRRAHSIADEKFGVYTVLHKFRREDFGRKVDFERCLILPLSVVFEATGKINLCCDRRADPTVQLCSFKDGFGDLLESWGGEKHRRIMKAIDVNKCPRCTYGGYNRIAERAFINDDMDYCFI